MTYILSVKDYELPLNEGARLFRCLTERNNDDFETVTGVVIENRVKRGLFGIRNQSRKVWKAVFPDQSVREVGPGKTVPVWKELSIEFDEGVRGKICL